MPPVAGARADRGLRSSAIAIATVAMIPARHVAPEPAPAGSGHAHRLGARPAQGRQVRARRRAHRCRVRRTLRSSGNADRDRGCAAASRVARARRGQFRTNARRRRRAVRRTRHAALRYRHARRGADAQAAALSRRADFCLLLDDVQDPGNVGSMLRSAAAAGVGQVLLSKHCAFAWSPKVLRAGQGAHFYVDLHEDVDLAAWARDFREAGGAVVTMVATGGTDLYDTPFDAHMALAIGNEGAGISAALAAQATQRVTIPMPGGVESLNAAAAAAVCLFECVRQREAGRSARARVSPRPPARRSPGSQAGERSGGHALGDRARPSSTSIERGRERADECVTCTGRVDDVDGGCRGVRSGPGERDRAAGSERHDGAASKRGASPSRSRRAAAAASSPLANVAASFSLTIRHSRGDERPGNASAGAALSTTRAPRLSPGPRPRPRLPPALRAA